MTCSHVHVPLEGPLKLGQLGGGLPWPGGLAAFVPSPSLLRHSWLPLFWGLCGAGWEMVAQGLGHPTPDAA